MPDLSQFDLEQSHTGLPPNFPGSTDTFLTGREYEAYRPDNVYLGNLDEAEDKEPYFLSHDRSKETTLRPVIKLLLKEPSAGEYEPTTIEVETTVSESPFNTLMKLQTPEEEQQRFFDVIRNSKIRTDGEVIANRLADLAAAQEEGDIEIDVKSLGQLSKFLLENNGLQTPDIVITNRGNYRVQWQQASNKHFAFEIYPDGNVKFVCFRINRTNPAKTDRFSGLTTIDDVVGGIMKPSNSWGWIVEKG